MPKKKYITTLIIVTILITSLISCTEKEKIPQEKFIKIYVDILIAQDTSSVLNPSLDSMKALVFERYDITDSLYEENIGFYNESPERWNAFFDSALVYIEYLKSKEGN